MCKMAFARFDEELLRALISGLGTSSEDGRGRQRYSRGFDAIGCLDDLRRVLHRDDPSTRRYFRTLGKWDVVRSDLAPLMCSCPSEKELVFKIGTCKRRHAVLQLFASCRAFAVLLFFSTDLVLILMSISFAHASESFGVSDNAT